MKATTFNHTVHYVDLDGDIVVLPDEFERSAILAQMDAVEAELAEKRLEIELLRNAEPATADDGEKKPSAIKQLQQRLHSLDYQAQETRNSLARTERLVKLHLPRAKKIDFVMHRYSWNEEAQIRDEAQEFGPTGSFTNERTYVLGILESCIESWSKPESITREEIGALSKPVLNSVFNRLATRSEPSPARLGFPGTDSTGLPGGEPPES